MKFIKTSSELRAAVASSARPQPCQCAIGACAGWESMAEYRWTAQQMIPVGTLRDAAVDEPTLEEHHPTGSRYDSANAPIALKFFPYNRCDVWHCSVCVRDLLRYTEFGGYNVDHRVRLLDPGNIVD